MRHCQFRFLFLICAILSSLGWTQSSGPQSTTEPKKISIGIMPVFDASGEDYGPIFTQNLTRMLWEQLISTNYEPVLLNPGGAYTPLDMGLVRDFAKMAGVDAVLAVSMQIPKKPREGSYTLKIAGQLMNVGTGDALSLTNLEQDVNRQDAIVETGYAGTGASRRFEKQPLGKKASTFAHSIRAELEKILPTLVTHGTASPAATSQGNCSINFHIAYPENNAISKSYDLIVNGENQSLWLNDGIANFSLRSGRILVMVSLRDAPYGIPLQHVYAANTYLNCENPMHSLALQIGIAGDASLKWQ